MMRRPPRSALFPSTTLFRSARGLGHAVLQAAAFVGDEPFAVLLGDDLIDARDLLLEQMLAVQADRKSTRLNSSHANISYAVFCLKKQPPSTDLRLHLALLTS